MNYILFDESEVRSALLPLTYLRPVSGIRVGVWTIKEKWERILGSVSCMTDSYLSEKYPLVIGDDNLCINAALCPNDALISDIGELKPGEFLTSNETVLAARISKSELTNFSGSEITGRSVEFRETFTLIDRPWKIFRRNGEQLRRDIGIIASDGPGEKLKDIHTVIYHPENVIIGKNVSIKSAVIDASNGPVYLADHTVISPGSIIKGPFAILEYSELNMGARMRGDITIGPRCKVGGEVSNSVFFGFSNKAHDGFLGNSVIAEWCNLGADTNSSNMKNDYTDVKLWNYESGRFESSGSAFCGLIMGDHSKAGINVMFNSGTSVGVSSSVYNSNYPRNFIPSFVKGGAQGWATMSLREAGQVASRVMERRDLKFEDVEERLFEKVFDLSTQYRRN